MTPEELEAIATRIRVQEITEATPSVAAADRAALVMLAVGLVVLLAIGRFLL